MWLKGTSIVLLLSLVFSTSGNSLPRHRANEIYEQTRALYDGLEPYEEDEEFSKLLEETLAEHEREAGNTHSRILAVNRAHREMAKRKLQKKAKQDKLDIMDEIIDVNLDKDFDYYEGDLILDKDDLDVIKHKAKETLVRRKKRNAIYQRYKLWISRNIPFAITTSLQHVRAVIYEAINEFHKKTCLRFREIRDGTRGVNYIRFINGNGCYSKMGKRYVSKGPQELSLGHGCQFKGTVLHELTHAIGFFHEQSRPDRDKYIKINWENVMKGKLDQFDRYSHGSLDTMNVNYDYDSLMHYGDKTFSSNGKKTIERLDGREIPFGNTGETFSAIDLVEINSLYDCRNAGRRSGYSFWSHWSPCDKNCYRERQRFCFSLSKRGCPGANAYGVQTQKLKCGRHECPKPVDGHWGAWGEWSRCSKSCDQGMRSRRRWCDNPRPVHGGKKCLGNYKEHSECQMRRCSYGPYDTEFEDGWGSWRNDPTADIPWKRQNHLTLTMGTGVKNDHTLGSDGGGYFIFTESSRRKKGDKARLISPYIPPTNGKCLTFYYSMNGKRIGDLDVWLKPRGHKGWLIFFAQGNKGPQPQWRNGYGNVQSNVPFKLVFEATLGGRSLSDFALDDIMLVDRKCHSPSPPPPTSKAACRDTYFKPDKCGVWARKGECTKNPKFMNWKCAKSCGVCKVPACQDKQEKCPQWAVKGECRKNKNWMETNCCLSCKNFKLAQNALCKDDNVECRVWARKGECKKNPVWMTRNCKKSCGKC